MVFVLISVVMVSHHFCYLAKKENNMISFNVGGEQLGNFPAVDAGDHCKNGEVRW